ncbi:HAD family hydrolase [Nonomuraea sp. NPDC050663]|uniref:HAD family hydrolase n=1 Tax=Nonomuraea sp. NPDC050663 TaxID=3364370 RepID=UPI0037B2ED9E
MTLKGILFDIDDTIFDYTGSERQRVLRHLADEGLLDRFGTPEHALERWRTIMEEEYARFLAGELAFEEQQLRRVVRFLDEVGVVPDDPAAWFARYAAGREAWWAPFPDAAPVLKELSERFVLGVVSNSALDHQMRKLRAIGLVDHFGEAIVCSQEHGCAKPDPTIFLAGCARLGLEPYETAYVGDKYDVDAIGARDAGLTAFWLDRNKSARPPEDGIRVIHSLTELLDVTSRL